MLTRAARFSKPTRSSKTGMRGFRIASPNNGVSGQYALRFPSNLSATDQSAPYVALEFVNPTASGFDLWGSGNTSGATVLWKIKPASQVGYFQFFWYSRGDGSFDGTNVPYWGAHPYPSRGYDDANRAEHIWEIATAGFDIISSTGTLWASGMNNPTITNGIQVTYGTTYTQALRVIRNSANSVTIRFYYNLPGTSYLEYTDTRTGIGDQSISSGYSHQLTVGDSPWWNNPNPYQHERLSGDLDAMMIVLADMSEADIVTQSGNFGVLNTADSIANIWWGHNGFNSVDDLTCQFGTGRSFTRDDSSNLLTTVARL